LKHFDLLSIPVLFFSFAGTGFEFMGFKMSFDVNLREKTVKNVLTGDN